MTRKPRTVDTIYTDVRDRLTNRITKLTNFTERSFNYVWTRAFANDLRDVELRALATELAGYIDYAGGPVSEQDLEQLGIDDVVTPEEINPYLNDQDLDELVSIVGVERSAGAKATGTVTIDTDASTGVTIQSGQTITTSPDSSGNTIDFETLNTVTVPVGTTTITDVDIEAVDVGEEYNLPADAITRFADPPLGVTGVTNPDATVGGEGRETNDELRERAKAAVEEQSGGGTVIGIEGYIVANVDGVREEDVIVDEFPSPCPPYSDVIVNGGSDQEVLDAIEESRPAAIQHNLVRPSNVQVEVDAVLNGSDIDTRFVKNQTETYLFNFGLGDNFYRDDLIRTILRTEPGILSIEQLDVYIQRVTGEQFEYDGSSTYSLEYTHDGGDVTVFDENGNTFVENTDYEIDDTTGNGRGDTIDWGGGGTDPGNGTVFFIEYDVNHKLELVRHEENTFSEISDDFVYEKNTDDYKLSEVPFPGTVSISGKSDSDYDIVNTIGEERSQTFTFESGRAEYPLDYQTVSSSVTIEDTDGNTPWSGNYTVQDKTGDGLDDTIVWDLSASDIPDDDEEFIVNFSVDNGIPQTLRWKDSKPSGGTPFTVNYEQRFYPLEYDVLNSYNGQILDQDGATTYDEGSDWDFADHSADREDDGILWVTGQSSPDTSDSFFVSYINEGDRNITIRSKVAPGDISISTQ